MIEPFKSSRSLELKRLLPRHYKILDLYQAGTKVKDIAQALGLSPNGVRLIIQSPQFQAELSKSRKTELVEMSDGTVSASVQARDILERASLKAAEVQTDLLEDESSKIKLAASNSILDRVFESKRSEGITISAETINLLQVALRESEVERVLEHAIE